jgi:ATP-dependent Clp endopeptidase proteolytic subunit ClpP
MTTPEQTPPQTPEQAAKLIAEADAATAAAEKARAEARKASAEARRAELELAKAYRAETAELARDEHHHVYRFVGSVTGTSVAACVAKLTEWHRADPGCDIEVIFTSPGGSVIDGFVLFDFVRGLSAAGHRITVGVLGMAASMAGILLQMGDRRWVGREGWVMIHRASFGVSGSTYEIEDEVEWVQRLEKRILDIFVERSGGKLTARVIKRNWDRKDWWLTSEEALEFGVVDEVR